MEKRGALPQQAIIEMIKTGAIVNGIVEHAQPASLDLTLSDEIYRVQSIFLPRPEESVRNAMATVLPERFDIRTPLETGVIYLTRLSERLRLPKDVYAYSNTKSSTGRIDIHIRMLADGIVSFDSVGARGYEGELWALITPGSFRIKVNPGDSLLQMRFFNKDTRFANEEELKRVYEETSLIFINEKPVSYSELRSQSGDGTLTLTINLDLDVVGYRSEGSQHVLDFSKRESHDSDDFFQPIRRPKNDLLTLRKGDFYILSTKEALRVPPEFAAEVKAIDVRSGDYRAHYAGFFDPGWGYGPDGTLNGAPAVLEVRSFEDNIVVRDGQPICKIVYERMTEIPTKVYGATGSHYLHQKGIKLSKHFK